MAGGRALVLRILAATTAVGMFVVLVMGAAVTNTGSAEGCGRSWPLCNGQFVPEFTVATAIEYSHRAVTGLEGILVVLLTGVMLVLWRRDREVVVLALLMLGTLMLQAGLGAGAVLAPQSPLMLATHFGVSLVAFASTFLSAVVVFERTRHPLKTQSLRVPTNVVIAVTAYVLCVVYLGAYIRHAGISLACADWPLCNGQLVPGIDAMTGPVFAHRLAALGTLALLLFLVRRTKGHPAAWMALGLALLQALSGAAVVWTRLGLFSTLAHAAIMALLFAALAHLLRAALTYGKRNDSVSDLYSFSDGAARKLHPAGATSRNHVLASTTAGSPGTGDRGAVADDSHGERAGAQTTEPAESRDRGT